MDAFEVGVILLVLASALAACLAARAGGSRRLGESGSGRDPRAAAAAQAARDAQDLQEMLAVTNARRRARGLPERSLGDAIREFGGD